MNRLHVADYNFLGVGDSGLLRFLAETMYSPQMNVKDATNLATYCVQKVEDYDECGGLIDVSILTRRNDRCESLSPESIQDRIKQMEKQEALLTDLIIWKLFLLCSPSIPLPRISSALQSYFHQPTAAEYPRNRAIRSSVASIALGRGNSPPIGGVHVTSEGKYWANASSIGAQRH